MKKLIFFVALAAILAVCGIYAIYGFCLRKSIPQAAPAEQVLAILEQNGCYQCHAQAPALPFYAKLPGMKQAMAKHVYHAQRSADLLTSMANPDMVDQVTLAKIEQVMLEESMPIMQYRMIHWGTGFNDREEGILAQWIAQQRAQRFATGLNAAAFANEPLQAIPSSVPYDSAIAELGKRLYHDTALSLDGTISCWTCHMLDQGGVSDHGHRTSEGINGQFGGVNAPTVFNAYFNVRQFWNGRAADLREQAAGPPANPVEMGDQTWDQIVARLRENKALVDEFARLYPEEGLTEYTVTSAIAEYEKTLLTPDGPFDRYLKGDLTAISHEAEEGYEEFKENGCAACHVGVIAGGQSFEYLGIFGDYFADRDASIAYNADDDGLKGFTGQESDLHRFKVPGLRNVALTAPYFHDGSMPTMEDAIRAMAKYQMGIAIDEEDVREISAFLQTL